MRWSDDRKGGRTAGSVACTSSPGVRPRIEAAALFDNKIDVSSYYSVTRSGSANDLGTLQKVLADVSPDGASVINAKALLNTPLSGKVGASTNPVGDAW